MRIASWLAMGLFLLPLSSPAQTADIGSAPLFVWSIYSRQVVTESGLLNKTPVPELPIAAFTPASPIRVRRIEAVSMDGPIQHGFTKSATELSPKDSTAGVLVAVPKPCPSQFLVVITNGKVRQAVPISNTFLGNGLTQTYTDSGPMNLRFAAGSRIGVSVVPPDPGVPPIVCGLYGVNITVQYEMDAPASSSNAEGNAPPGM